MEPEEQFERWLREEWPSTAGNLKAARTLDTLSWDIHELKTALKNETENKPAIASVQIFSLPAGEYDLKQPITVILKIYDDEVISLFPDLALHGEGDNEIEAVNDLKMQLLDLYDDLNDMDDDELGEEPKAWKRTLNKLISKCR